MKQQKAESNHRGTSRCAIANIYRFIEPVVLFLLKSTGGSYGYELLSMFDEHALTDASIEGAGLYRTLQRLEENGHVISEWDIVGNGPARHKYRLTPQGEEHLDEWVVALDQLGHSMEAFVAKAKGPSQFHIESKTGR